MISVARYFSLCLFLSGTLFFALPLSLTQAQEAPDLVGTWTGDHSIIIHRDGAVELGKITTVLTIKQQDGPYFQGSKTWKRQEKISVYSDIGEELATEGLENIVGVIGFDGETVTIAEGEDSGVHHGRLIDRDQMMLTYVESDIGDAVLFRAILTRQRLPSGRY
ncbi:hypothetical protein NBZ79_09355 [Sneathiella marina]|uniref:Lipocalin-like domain-containing protein n=1 Tax=Sneathiella marina TaxID=2950108 RepID=A0ABY4W8K6_9PROT|nr:hypothetical protein [Sneathiella marina]USG63181.1 hypothetical protein NBZ79_09355 [Sneathiella marina]